jgi:hypothetical protein
MYRRTIGIALLVAAALAASLLLLGGGGDAGGAGGHRSAAETRFSGQALPGTLYLSAGKDYLNADLYRAGDSLGSVKRLTRGGRVSSLDGFDDRLALSDARTGADRLELANLGGGPVLPGRVIDEVGQSPAYGPGGRLLYQVQRFTDDGGDGGVRLYLADQDGRHRRSALVSPTSDVTSGFGPQGQVAVVYDEKPRIVLDPGGSAERTLRVPLRHVVDFRSGVNGRMYAVDGEHRIAFLDRPEGKWRVFSTPWRGPLAWAPDGSSALVVRGDRIGLMSPADGSVREIGRVENGQVFGAAWVGDRAE